MVQRTFDILVDGPTLTYPNGGESISGSTIDITWEESTNLPSENIIWYEIFITETYDENNLNDLIQIATIPSGNSTYTYNINKNLKGSKCRIGIRAVNNKGQRSNISFSANNFVIISKKLPIPAVFKPTFGTTYFSYVPIVLDNEGVVGRCSQRAFYQIYYSSKSLGIDWILIFKNIMVGTGPINWDVSSLFTSSDYSIKIELVDANNVSEPVFINDITIKSVNYFIIDTIPPKGEVKIQNNSEYTKDRDLIVSLNSYDAATATKEYRVEQTNINIGDDTIDMGIFSNMTDLITWDIVGDDGEKLIRVRFKDYGGNVAEDTEDVKYFRTYKSLYDLKVADVIVNGEDVWIAFSNEDNPSYSSALYRNTTLISSLSGIPTSLAYYGSVLYISIKDSENKGILQRYSGGVVEAVVDNEEQYLDDDETVVNSLYSSDSVISSMEIFDDTLFLGMDNGNLLSFNGTSISVENNDYANIRKINRVKTDGNVLYIFFDNSTELMVMSKLSDGTYNFSIIETEE